MVLFFGVVMNTLKDILNRFVGSDLVSACGLSEEEDERDSINTMKEMIDRGKMVIGRIDSSINSPIWFYTPGHGEPRTLLPITDMSQEEAIKILLNSPIPM